MDESLVARGLAGLIEWNQKSWQLSVVRSDDWHVIRADSIRVEQMKVLEGCLLEVMADLFPGAGFRLPNISYGKQKIVFGITHKTNE